MSENPLDELLGAYALGALSEEERGQVEQHLASSARLRQELAHHRAVVENLGSMHLASPPETLWDRITDELDSGDAQLTPVGKSPRLTDGRRGRRWIAPVAAATALVLGAAVVVQSLRIQDLNRTVDDQRAEIGALEADAAIDPYVRAAELAVAAPTSQSISLTNPARAAIELTIVVESDGRAHVTSSSLDPLPPELTYQLWAIMEDGRVISAAILGDARPTSTFHVDIDGLSGFAITEEVRGGVVSSDNEAVVVGHFEA